MAAKVAAGRAQPRPQRQPRGSVLLACKFACMGGAGRGDKRTTVCRGGPSSVLVANDKPNTPFESVPPHMQSALDSHVSVRGHYTSAHVLLQQRTQMLICLRQLFFLVLWRG